MTSSLQTSDDAQGWVGDFQFDQSAVADAPRRGRRWARWAIALGVVALIAVAVVWVINPFGTTAATLVTAQATTGTIVSSVSISGSVASSAVEELNFAASGAVTAINVAAGDKVAANQVLATIDATTLNLQIQTAQANLLAAQARLTTDTAGPTAATLATARDSVKQAQLQLSSAKTNLSDTKLQNTQSINQAKAAVAAAQATLAADTLASPSDTVLLAKDAAAVANAQSALSSTQLKATLSLHQAQQQLASATLGVTSAQDNYNLKIAPATDAQLAADKAAVATAQQALTTLKETGPEIIAPIAGTVTVVNLKVGQQVTGSQSSASSSSASTGQIEIMDLTRLQIAGQASETDIAKLKMAQAATISATALGSETVIGKICALSVVGTQISGVTSFGVTVCIDGANPALLVGMSATAAVVTSRADNAVLVPSLAVKTVGGQQVVTVLGADGKTETNMPVTVGISNGSQTQILTGLTGTETVVETLQTNTTNRNGFGGGGRGVFPGGGGFGG